MPLAHLLNQMKKIRETEREIYPSSFVISTQLLKNHLPLVRGESLADWFRDNFCGLVAALFDLLVESITKSAFVY